MNTIQFERELDKEDYIGMGSYTDNNEEEREMILNSEIKKRFLSDTDETGRHIVTSYTTGIIYFVEPIGDGRMADWGSYNPSTGNVENKKGAGKSAGSVTEEESLITKENGFKKIELLGVGESPMGEIMKRDKEYERVGVRLAS